MRANAETRGHSCSAWAVDVLDVQIAPRAAESLLDRGACGFQFQVGPASQPIAAQGHKVVRDSHLNPRESTILSRDISNDVGPHDAGAALILAFKLTGMALRFERTVFEAITAICVMTKRTSPSLVALVAANPPGATEAGPSLLTRL